MTQDVRQQAADILDRRARFARDALDTWYRMRPVDDSPALFEWEIWFIVLETESDALTAAAQAAREKQ